MFFQGTFSQFCTHFLVDVCQFVLEVAPTIGDTFLSVDVPIVTLIAARKKQLLILIDCND